MFSMRARCASLKYRDRELCPSAHFAMPPTKMANVVGRRQVHADREQHRALHLNHDHRDAQHHAVTTSGHGMSPPTMPCERDAIRPACGAETGVAEADPPVMLPLCSTSSGKVHHQAGDDDRDQLDDLDGARSAAENVADLEILQQLAGDRRRDADHRGHAENCRPRR